MEKVFISHSMKDSHLVRVLVKNLEIYSVEAYIAERDYQPGKQLSQKIMQNIDTSNYFLVVYTINGEDSIYVQQEIGYWLGKKKFNDFIPLVAKGINPRGFLHGLEFIEFDQQNPKLGIANVINYVKQQIEIKRKQLLIDVGIGLGIIGLAALIVYLLSKLDED
ncbi:unnamed protein product [marine sediment metagenome]|uniref:TIR domain-containing protein n=1 Tax=marine sediment metagenome TaxID=412755 RepID=X1T1C7_9ZZZZ